MLYSKQAKGRKSLTQVNKFSLKVCNGIACICLAKCDFNRKALFFIC